MFKYIFKFILIGDYETGKTAIFERFSSNDFREIIPTTIGVQFMTKVIEVCDIKVKVSLWDTSGQERFKAITNSYLRNITCALVTFDLSSIETFKNVNYWIEKTKEKNKNNVIILVATKSDLECKVSKKLITSYVLENDLLYCETSSKDNININELFTYACSKILDNINNKIIKDSDFNTHGIKLNEEYDKEQASISKVNKCC
jgi:Ras-related protein Rab-14